MNKRILKDGAFRGPVHKLRGFIHKSNSLGRIQYSIYTITIIKKHRMMLKMLCHSK